MRQVVTTRNGGVEVLEVQIAPDPNAGPGSLSAGGSDSGLHRRGRHAALSTRIFGWPGRSPQPTGHSHYKCRRPRATISRSV